MMICVSILDCVSWMIGIMHIWSLISIMALFVEMAINTEIHFRYIIFILRCYQSENQRMQATHTREQPIPPRELNLEEDC